MDRYLPPAGIDDFSRSAAANLHQDWHDRIVDVIAEVRDPAQYDLASPLFYDQLSDSSGAPEGQPQGIPWNGFPKRLTAWFDQGSPQQQDEAANHAAEVVLQKAAFGLFHENRQPIELPFRVQDEYCEWHVEREGQAIKRISFTCEPPEYWEFLAAHDFDLVHTLYTELLHDSNIPEDDLKWPFDAYRLQKGQLKLAYHRGDYNPWNTWNTQRGLVHLTHPANSLNAEMVLASDGTLGWPVAPDAQGKIDEIKLMCCAGRGGVNRSSDPLILKGVFDIARQGLSVALANPIGLYMAPFTLAGLLDPDDKAIGAACLRSVRQSADGSRVLRVEIAPPEGAALTLDQCTLDGSPLRYGGQIARSITMRLFGVAKQIPGRAPRAVVHCPNFCCPHPRHTSFRGAFAFEDFPSCNQVTDSAWSREAYDIPEPSDGLSPMAVGDFGTGVIGEQAPRPDPGPMRPLGRRAIAVDSQPRVKLQDY